MRRWIIVATLFVTGAVQAKQLNNPDENTLWMEDGKEIELSAKPDFNRWMEIQGNKRLEIIPKEDGKGFSMLAEDSAGRKTVTKVTLSPEYPYLTFRITGFDLLKGYRNWTVLMEIGGFGSSQVTAPQKGIFVYDLYQNISEQEKAKKTAYLHFYLYNLRMDLEYIKLVKKPDYVVRAECADPEIKPGSIVKFTAELAKEAEDVSITMITAGQPRPVKINDALKIQLNPVDKTRKVWSADVEIKSIDLPKEVKRHQLFMKMDVLGGDLDEPVWVGLPYAVLP